MSKGGGPLVDRNFLFKMLKMLSDMAKRNAHWQGSWSRSNMLYFNLCINLRSSLLFCLQFLTASTDWEQTEVTHYPAESMSAWFGICLIDLDFRSAWSECFVWGKKNICQEKVVEFVFILPSLLTDSIQILLAIGNCMFLLHSGTQVLWGYCPFIAITSWYCWILQ